MTNFRIVLFALLASLGACSGGSSPKGVLQSVRSALNPPPPPPDTIPEMLDYAPDLQVSVADMAKLPEGVFWQDVQDGDTLVAAAMMGDSVEIGANCCIDRAALGVTSIGEGAKLDNMVHVAHNCRIGRHVVVAAQTGFSGGVSVGDYAVIGGQVGIGDKARIEPRAVLGSGHDSAAKAGVNALTLTMAMELAPRIRVNGIAPGMVPTEVMMTALDMDVPDLERTAHACGFRIARITFYTPLVGGFVENIMMRMAERAMARRAARRLHTVNGTHDVDAQAVREARTAAKAQIARSPATVAVLQALSMAMKLDGLLFGRITSGPFFALLVKDGAPGREPRAAGSAA